MRSFDQGKWKKNSGIRGEKRDRKKTIRGSYHIVVSEKERKLLEVLRGEATARGKG